MAPVTGMQKALRSALVYGYLVERNGDYFIRAAFIRYAVD
jgi:hypothetical protein